MVGRSFNTGTSALHGHHRDICACEHIFDCEIWANNVKPGSLACEKKVFIWSGCTTAAGSLNVVWSHYGNFKSLEGTLDPILDVPP